MQADFLPLVFCMLRGTLRPEGLRYKRTPKPWTPPPGPGNPNARHRSDVSDIRPYGPILIHQSSTPNGQVWWPPIGVSSGSWLFQTLGRLPPWGGGATRSDGRRPWPALDGRDDTNGLVTRCSPGCGCQGRSNEQVWFERETPRVQKVHQ